LKVFKETQKAPSFSLPVDKFKPDYRACVQNMQAKKPLGLLLIGTPVSVSAGINAVRAAGSKATIATLSNNAATGFVQALKDNAAGIVVSQVFPSERSLKSPMIAEAARLAGTKGVKKPLTPAMIEGFAAAKVLVVALKRAAKEREGVTRGSIKRALESFNRVDIGAGGGAEISFSSSDHTGLDYVDLSIIGEDGTFRR
jgi:branched-chain amino acid transport system substrate-binding protein